MLVYSKEDLLSLREKNAHNLNRHTRKVLIKLKLWCPLIDQKYLPAKHKHPDFSRCALLNPWSVNKKESAIHQFIIDANLDFLALTETWLSDLPKLAAVNIARLRPVGYSFIYTPRLKQKGGDVFTLCCRWALFA